MILSWSVDDVLRAVCGKLLHPQDWTAHGVSIDSRTVSKGDLFIAIKGDAFDGHDFVRAAIDAGACAAIVSRQPSQVPPDAPLIFVEDTMEALQALGQAGRARAKAKIIAVTGSVGKTSTKEQLRLMLGAVDDTFANEGSLNNHWGVPLTLARLPQDAKYAVIEIGMNHAGELGPLSKSVAPHVALITNVEAVHLEFFETTEAIANAKAEIFEGMDSKGVAVLNHDNPHFARLAAIARAHGIKKILSFGRDAKSDAKLLSLTPEEASCTVQATLMGKPITYTVGAAGAHFAFNALGALLGCSALGADTDLCAQALAAYRQPNRRGSRQCVTRPDGGTITLIDETFNASPVATQAAIDVLGQTSLPSNTGRRIAVLGDMRELGPEGPALHADLADALLRNQIHQVYCCGELMSHLYNAIPPEMRGGFAMTSSELAPLVAADVHSGDVVMVKGSKSMHMEYVVQAVSTSSNPQKIAS